MPLIRAILSGLLIEDPIWAAERAPLAAVIDWGGIAVTLSPVHASPDGEAAWPPLAKGWSPPDRTVTISC